MNSDRTRPAWLTLAWWYAKDHALKAAVERRFGSPTPWTRSDEERLIETIGWILGLPLLLTPLVTWLLYPWLPQPDAAMYIQMGVAGVAIAGGIRLERKRLARGQHTHSVNPPAPSLEAGSSMRQADDEHHPGS